jgi:hypothetical protein
MAKQLKLNELKRVVDVDKFSKYATRLRDHESTSEEEIDRILTELGKKMPSKEVLMKTRLGFILKDLGAREGLSNQVREKAKSLRTKWKEFHKRLLLAPIYDVKCDKPTTENRQKAKVQLENALSRLNSSGGAAPATLFDSSSVVHSNLVSSLEFAIFQHCDKLVNSKYFNTIRLCIRLFNDKPDVRRQLLNSEIKVDDLIHSYLTGDVFKNFKPSPCSSSAAAANDYLDDELLLLDE